MSWRHFLAWCVHFYTALGLVAAGGIALAILAGTPASFRLAFLLMLLATIIDATDGTLARLVRVKEVLPKFDGRKLDDLIDFQTYVFLPLLLIYRAGVLPEGHEAWLLLPILAGAYGFCQVSAKTDDGYFLGFPSYWNIIAFYLYVLKPPGSVSIGLLVFFALMTFVPARYLYPTQPGRLNRWANILGAVWCVLIAMILFSSPEDEIFGVTRLLTLISLIYPAFYLIASWFVSARMVYRAWAPLPLRTTARS